MDIDVAIMSESVTVDGRTTLHSEVRRYFTDLLVENLYDRFRAAFPLIAGGEPTDEVEVRRAYSAMKNRNKDDRSCTYTFEGPRGKAIWTIETAII